MPIVYIDIVDKSEDDVKRAILDVISDQQQRVSDDGYPVFYNLEHVEIDVDYICVGRKYYLY